MCWLQRRDDQYERDSATDRTAGKSKHTVCKDGRLLKEDGFSDAASTAYDLYPIL